MSAKFSDSVRNACANAVVDLIDAGDAAGTIKIYTGTQPAGGPGAAVTGTLLATLTFSDPAFGAAASGSAAADTITADSTVDADGTAGYSRIADSDGNALVDLDITATGGTGKLTFNSTSFIAGGTAGISALTCTVPATVS